MSAFDEERPSERSNRWATRSVVAAVPGLLIPGLGIIAIVCGVLSRRKREPGRGMSAAGIVLGGIGTLFSFGCVLPSFQMVRELQHKIYCASNLKQIADAMNHYENNNLGWLPPDFSALLKAEQLDPAVFVCPSTGDTPAPGSTSAEQASHLLEGGHLSYVYLGKGLRMSMNGDVIIAYDAVSHTAKVGLNVLYLSGDIQFLSETALKAEIANQVTDQHPDR